MTVQPPAGHVDMRSDACASPNRAQRGLTLVELMVGVGIVGILLAVAIPAMSNFMERRRVIAVTGELSSIIAYAKAETNSANDGISIHLESDSTSMSCAAVVTQTLNDDCKCNRAPDQICAANSGKLLRLFQLPRGDGVSFSATATPGWGGSDEVLAFNRNSHSQAEQRVRLSVTGARTGVQLRIDINEAGRTLICSPVGRVGGYPTCS